MSLTSLLDDRNSLLRRWFEARLPNLKPMQAAYRAAGSPSLLPPVDPYPYGTVGTAFDYRARYYFGVTPPEEFVAALGAARIAFSDGTGALPVRGALPYERLSAALAELTKRLQPIGRRLPRSEEEVLCRFCYVLALFEQCFRAGLRPQSPLLGLSVGTPVETLLTMATDAAVDDLCALSWAFYETQGDLIALRDEAVLNPTFQGSELVGGADANLIVSGCLFDVKITKTKGLSREDAYQLLGYPLLDFDDLYKIGAVGFYLGRLPGKVTWALDQVLLSAGGQDATLERLRGELEQILLKVWGQ